MPDHYGRVTNPERFRPLHAIALARIAALEAAYDVVREDGGTMPGPLGRVLLERPPIVLRPADALAAPLTIGLSAFPGGLVQAGRATGQALPACGCDACDDDPDRVAETLDRLIEVVVSGGFGETIPLAGAGSHATRAWRAWPRRAAS